MRGGAAPGYARDSGGSSARRGKAVPAANRNHARKMYQGAFSRVRNGIGSEIGSTANTPIMARQPAITKTAIFGACKVIWDLSKRLGSKYQLPVTVLLTLRPARILLEGGLYQRERGPGLGADAGEKRDDGNRDPGGDQAIFDGGRGALISEKGDDL